MSKSHTDQLGNILELNESPQRIICVVPSITELLLDFGLQDEIVGRTKFCIHPLSSVRSIPRIGGTKNLNIPKIIGLNPDLIIANKEENTKEQIEELQKQFPVWISDIKDYLSAIKMIKNLGVITNRQEESIEIIDSIDSLRMDHTSLKNVLYLIWKNPYMSIGGDTFISKMLEEAGFINILKNKLRYPQLSLDKMKLINPEFIFLSSEPYPFKDKHKLELEVLFPNSKVVLVDGEMFSWYGSRILKAYPYFQELNKSLSSK